MTSTQQAAPGLDLDDLLIESLEVADARKQLKAARPKLTDQRVGSSERSEIEAKIREWEAVSEWRPAAVSALFLVQTCRCGTQSVHFKGVFQRQSHRTNTLNRWVREESPAHFNLPKEQKYDTEAVAMCHRCCDRHGFSLPQLNVPSAFPNSRTF